MALKKTMNNGDYKTIKMSKMRSTKSKIETINKLLNKIAYELIIKI